MYIIAFESYSISPPGALATFVFFQRSILGYYPSALHRTLKIIFRKLVAENRELRYSLSCGNNATWEGRSAPLRGSSSSKLCDILICMLNSQCALARPVNAYKIFHRVLICYFMQGASRPYQYSMKYFMLQLVAVVVKLFCNTLFDKYLPITSLHWC